jgi:hypothetical protein
MVIADIHSVGNAVESGLWFVMAVGLLIAGVRRPKIRNMCSLAAVTLILFGLSDVVEIQTGAWWRPWWLLVWKGACLLVLAILMRNWLAHRRKCDTNV